MNQKELEATVENYKTQVKQILKEIETLCVTFESVDSLNITDNEKYVSFQDILDRIEVCDKQWKKAEDKWWDAQRDLNHARKANAHKFISEQFNPFNQVMGRA